ncbi:MAG: transposase, partial [Anaerolineae bacterium]
DNGAEFINEELVRYCAQEHLTFTRGRAGRKNDNPYVEQKNWSVVRRLVGYARYDTPRQVQLLNQLYSVYLLYVNHFLPVMKLLRKERQGSRTKRIYDEPKTPYQRVLDAPTVSKVAKAKLRAQHRTLDVVHLKQQIDKFLAALKASAGE